MSAELDRQALADMHAVYRMFDSSGRLLYVGMTGDVGGRFGNHAVKRWFSLVETIRLEWHPSRDEARAAERRAIRAEGPRYNIVGPRTLPHHQQPPPATLQLVAAHATLAEAVAARVIRGTLAAARKASQRDPVFPPAVGRRGIAHLYEVAALVTWQAGRR